MNLLRKLGFLLVFVVLAGSILSFFANPTVVSPVKILDQKEELESPEFKNREDPGFSERVVNSTWAMVLVHSEFSDKNASGLEALRNWAKQNLTLDNQFLNPIELPRQRENKTIIGSLFGSFFGLPIKFTESLARELLSQRIAAFHQTDAYQTFRGDFYELFGVNKEAVKLLYRYQEDRAKDSIKVLLSCLFWTITSALILFNHFKEKSARKFGVFQRSLAYLWTAFACFYLFMACNSNSSEALAAAVICLVTGLYIAFPLSAIRDEKNELTLVKYELSARACAILLWITISLSGIQIINWIKGGILTDPDPITLLIGAITGNFLHDPTTMKRTVAEVIGVAWLSLTIWTAYYYKINTGRSREVESELKSLGKQKVSIQ